MGKKRKTKNENLELSREGLRNDPKRKKRPLMAASEKKKKIERRLPKKTASGGIASPSAGGVFYGKKKKSVDSLSGKKCRVSFREQTGELEERKNRKWDTTRERSVIQNKRHGILQTCKTKKEWLLDAKNHTPSKGITTLLGRNPMCTSSMTRCARVGGREEKGEKNDMASAGEKAVCRHHLKRKNSSAAST